MIILSDELLLGKGKARACYFDPTDPSRCIKVDWPGRSFSQTKQEGKYYRWLAKHRPSFQYDCIPRFHGFVATDRGPGGVFDLVRDASSGAASSTLHHYLHAGRVASEPALWDAALQRLRNSVLANSLVIGDLNAVNICARLNADDSIHLVIVDGIGHRDLIPFCDFFPFLARRRSAREIARFGITSVQALIDHSQRQRARVR